MSIVLSSPSRAAAPDGADPEITKLVPAEIRKAGVLVVGTEAANAPFESVDPVTNKIVGFDADMALDIGKLLGLRVELVNSSFDSLIPSITSGKYNVAISTIGDTGEREAVVDFVTYYWNSTSLLVPKGNPKRLSKDSLCKARIGVQRGSLQQNLILPELMAHCPPGDEELKKGVVFKTNPDAVLALASGRIDGMINDTIPVQFAAEKSNGQFQVVGPLMRNKNPGGIALRKDSGLQQAVLAAVKKLMASGQYRKNLEKWHLLSIAIDDPVINWNSHQNGAGK